MYRLTFTTKIWMHINTDIN